jgi:hypothetical protein
MIDIYLDYHTDSCKKGYFHDICGICYFLLFIKNKYILIRYHNCENYFGHLDYKQDLIKRIIKDNKIFPLFDVEREKYSYNDFCMDSNLNLPLKKYAKQINYIYYDNAGKQYAITTKSDFFDEIFLQQDRNKSFNECKEYLKNIGLEDLLLTDLNKLHQANSINYVTEIESVKSIDSLIKSIDKLIKQ